MLHPYTYLSYNWKIVPFGLVHLIPSCFTLSCRPPHPQIWSFEKIAILNIVKEYIELLREKGVVWEKRETSELELDKEFRMNSVTLLKSEMIVVTLLHPYRCQLKKKCTTWELRNIFNWGVTEHVSLDAVSQIALKDFSKEVMEELRYIGVFICKNKHNLGFVGHQVSYIIYQVSSYSVKATIGNT